MAIFGQLGSSVKKGENSPLKSKGKVTQNGKNGENGPKMVILVWIKRPQADSNFTFRKKISWNFKKVKKMTFHPTPPDPWRNCSISGENRSQKVQILDYGELKILLRTQNGHFGKTGHKLKIGPKIDYDGKGKMATYMTKNAKWEKKLPKWHVPFFDPPKNVFLKVSMLAS